MAKNLTGPEENRAFIEEGRKKILEYFSKVPAEHGISKRELISRLHLDLGHSTDYVRTELIYAFVDVGELIENNNTIFLPTLETETRKHRRKSVPPPTPEEVAATT